MDEVDNGASYHEHVRLNMESATNGQESRHQTYLPAVRLFIVLLIILTFTLIVVVVLLLCFTKLGHASS
jgi:hypothetical protein